MTLTKQQLYMIGAALLVAWYIDKTRGTDAGDNGAANASQEQGLRTEIWGQ